MVDVQYNGRLPMRWNLEGVAGIFVFDLHAFSNPSHLQFFEFRPLDLEWEHRGHVVAGPFSFDCSAIAKFGFPEGRFHFTIKIDDGAGSKFALFWDLPPRVFPVTRSFLWPISTPTSQTTSGPITWRASLSVRAVSYAQEP